MSPSSSPPPPPDSPPRDPHLSRRSFIQSVGVTAAAGAAVTAVEAGAAELLAENEMSREIPSIGPHSTRLTLNVNGHPATTEVDPAATLAEVLRWSLGLTGTKVACDRGACGGCSVMVDGQLISSCMMLAVDAVDHEITTVEGIGSPRQLDPIQEAFVKHDALQCGYCTPGLIVACRTLLNDNPRPTMEEIRQGLSGNLCRCGTYTNVFNAVLDASGQNVPVDGKGGGR